MTTINPDSYFNRFGLLKAHKHENDQNSLLRLAYYHRLLGNIDGQKYTNGAYDSLTMMSENGHYSQHPEVYWKEDVASHDEMVGILYFLVVMKLHGTIGQIKIWYYMRYPQVFFHLMAIKTDSVIFRYLSSLWSLASIWNRSKAKNGGWDTDSTLLTLLKMRTIINTGKNYPFWKPTLKRIEKVWGPEYEKTLVNIMLHDEPNHPLRLIFA